MWAFFIFVLGLFGIFLINTFGVITTTNQQDYTLLKNAVEASMIDAIDLASYRAGFWLCLSDTSTATKDQYGVLVFNSKNDYYLVLNTPGVSTTTDLSKCSQLTGEVKLNKDVFVESFIRRFANNINNNKSYQITVQEVIEYPPKVSIRIDTYNTYGSKESETLEFSPGEYTIRNQIDAILEERN